MKAQAKEREKMNSANEIVRSIRVCFVKREGKKKRDCSKFVRYEDGVTATLGQ